MNLGKLTKLLLPFLVFGTTTFSQIPGKWGDQRDGTYNNPILPGDYSDLDAIRVGSDFYAISSTMQFSPGMVVLHSKDLVNWRIAGHVVDDLTQISPELNWDKMNRYGRGIWAGSIRYYKGKYRVYFGTPDEGFFMSSATNPAGPWEPLHQLWKVSGWDDCCPFMDDDGQMYFIATNFSLDLKNNKKYNIHLFRMTPDGREIIMESDSIIYQSTGSEANKLYKINGLYYHYFSEVTSEGRVPMMGRSKNIYGPYEIKQLNHVNKSKDREPNQGGLIKLESGDWWFLTHHGSGGFWEGRVASLLPVTWVNGWPIIGEVGSDMIGNMIWSSKKPIKSNSGFSIQTVDDFSNKTLNVQWEWNYQPRADKWSLTDNPGHMRLYAFKPLPSVKKGINILSVGNTLTQRSMKTDSCEAIVKIDLKGLSDGQFAGICHFAGTYSAFGVRQTEGIRRLVYDNNGQETEGKIIDTSAIYLRSVWGIHGLSQYAFSINGKLFESFGETYKLTWGNYRGDRIGIFCYNSIKETGFIDVDWLHYKY
jgi:beta-xylosidase